MGDLMVCTYRKLLREEARRGGRDERREKSSCLENYPYDHNVFQIEY
jgi:hypothetical protein